MSRRRTVEEWRRDVLSSKAPEMTGAVKVLLVYLSDHMRPDRKVSVPRKQIADELGCHEQRIAERFKKAVDAQYLTNVVPGHRGVTAVYEGCWPNEVSVPISGTQTGRKRTDLPDAIEVRKSVRYSAGKRTAPLDATSRADLPVGPDHSNDGYGQKDEPDVRFSLTALETSAIDCPHGLPGGMFPDPWDDVSHPACPECHATRSKSERDGRRLA